MALPGTGAISLAAIQTEFGGANPISLNEYYRGGAYVTANNANVPSSGAINFDQFHGASKQTTHTVSLNKAGVGGSCTNAIANCTATTDTITATVAGGVGPFTYAHQLVSGTSIAPVNNTSATTAHSKSCPPSMSYSAVYRVAVTDTGNGNLVAYSANYTVDVENFG